MLTQHPILAGIADARCVVRIGDKRCHSFGKGLHARHVEYRRRFGEEQLCCLEVQMRQQRPPKSERLKRDPTQSRGHELVDYTDGTHITRPKYRFAHRLDPLEVILDFKLPDEPAAFAYLFSPTDTR